MSRKKGNHSFNILLMIYFTCTDCLYEYQLRHSWPWLLQVPLKHRDASVQVRDTWEVVEDLDFPRMSKLTLPDIAEGEDL